MNQIQFFKTIGTASPQRISARASFLSSATRFSRISAFKRGRLLVLGALTALAGFATNPSASAQTYQPDLRLYTMTTPLMGIRVYRPNTPGPNQTITVTGRARKGRATKFFFGVNNAGDVPDRIGIFASRPNINHQRYRVRIFQRTRGKKNVTGQFAARDFEKNLALGGTILFRYELTPKKNFRKTVKRTIFVRARSTGDTDKIDRGAADFILTP